MVPISIDVTWGQGGKEGQMPLEYFFYLKVVFLATELKRRQIKKLGTEWGERGVCILRTGSIQSPHSL
jgi:hypothetical protein